MKAPKNKRSFPGVWVELVYLRDKVKYWLVERNSRFRASRFIKRLRRALRIADRDGPEGIICLECHALLAEFSKQWSEAARFRRQEIKSCIRLHEISKNDDQKVYILEGLGQDHVAQLHIILERNLRNSGNHQEADRVVEENREYCRINDALIKAIPPVKEDISEICDLADKYLDSKNKKIRL